MPSKPLRPCNHPGCPILSDKRFCRAHDVRIRSPQSIASRRLTNNQRWRQARKIFLANHPLCVECSRVATIVDHIIEHEGNYQLMWDIDNWQSLCKPCHDKKTARYYRRKQDGPIPRFKVEKPNGTRRHVVPSLTEELITGLYKGRTYQDDSKASGAAGHS